MILNGLKTSACRALLEQRTQGPLNRIKLAVPWRVHWAISAEDSLFDVYRGVMVVGE